MKTKTLAPNSSSVAKRLGSYGKKMENGGSLNKKSTNPKKPVVKKTNKDSKTISQRIGDITLRDVKNAGEDALQLATLGGYSKIKKALGGEYKYKKIGEKKYGGKINKAENGTSLGMKSVKAGYDKNPGVTRADFVSIGKGEAKSGASIKKAKSGAALKKQAAVAIAMKKAGKSPKKAMMGATTKPMMKAGGKMTKCKYGCK